MNTQQQVQGVKKWSCGIKLKKSTGEPFRILVTFPFPYFIFVNFFSKQSNLICIPFLKKMAPFFFETDVFVQWFHLIIIIITIIFGVT